jgi:hypothetical protein
MSRHALRASVARRLDATVRIESGRLGCLGAKGEQPRLGPSGVAAAFRRLFVTGTATTLVLAACQSTSTPLQSATSPSTSAPHPPATACHASAPMCIRLTGTISANIDGTDPLTSCQELEYSGVPASTNFTALFSQSGVRYAFGFAIRQFPGAQSFLATTAGVYVQNMSNGRQVDARAGTLDVIQAVADHQATGTVDAELAGGTHIAGNWTCNFFFVPG